MVSDCYPTSNQKGGEEEALVRQIIRWQSLEQRHSLILITKRSAGCLIRGTYAMLIIPANFVIMQFFINPAMYKLGIEM